MPTGTWDKNIGNISECPADSFIVQNLVYSLSSEMVINEQSVRKCWIVQTSIYDWLLYHKNDSGFVDVPFHCGRDSFSFFRLMSNSFDAIWISSLSYLLIYFPINHFYLSFAHRNRPIYSHPQTLCELKRWILSRVSTDTSEVIDLIQNKMA